MKYRFHKDIAFCRVVFCKSKGRKISILQSIHYLELLNVGGDNTWKTSLACVAKKDCNKLVPQINYLHFVFSNTLDSHLRAVELKYKQTHVNTCKYMYTHTHCVFIQTVNSVCWLPVNSLLAQMQLGAL